MDILKIRKDFPMLRGIKMQGKDLIYFDNAATSLKPQCVIDAISDYYSNYNANSHRGDYDIAHRVDVEVEETRKLVSEFINAEHNEIVFVSNTSMGLNMVAYGLLNEINEGDEILISEAEHASNVLPWFKLSELKKAQIKYIPLDEKGRITLDNLKKSLTSKTKVVALAHVSNVLGHVLEAKECASLIHEVGAYFVLDGAQSVPHMKVDVKDIDCDFLCFSGHKMLGPTGIGILYGKYYLLCKLDPLLLGGGMNTTFDMCGNVGLQHPPLKFEAGTPNIEGIVGFKAAINYINSIGIEEIDKRERYLKRYAIDKLKELDNVILYNEDSPSSIISFNIKGVFSQDSGSYFNSKGICVRTGLHCAKILVDFLKTEGTVRASLAFYNTEEEIDTFVEACRNGGNFLDAFFA